MKKHIQRQLLGLMKSVANGVTYIKGNPQTNQTQTVYNDCNAAINMVRKTFESELSEQSYTSYAELFDKVMNGLEGSAGIQNEAVRKQLLDGAISALHDLDRTLQSETEINKEIVFFPYKASMWDSMESIWRAAKEDPRCDVYVVPIPHFANGIMTYEGHLYPKDVQVIHYSAYKMGVQKPDVTYIHQPYDGYNRTHKDDITYFASELKKHTKKLVYVPYYVTGGSVSDYAISLPSFKAVDLIVAESEQIRERYLKYWPEEKVVALGSPKFDKVVYHQQKGVEVPPSWKEKIEGKKVVLYNTSIAALLTNIPSYLKKLKYVIESFESNKEMVLLWRPHPLIKSKLQPVPAYLQEYIRLEQYFVQKNVGILDVTPDLHVSIAVSDVYYGDISSLIPLFAATGKPVVRQDLSTVDDLNRASLSLRFEAMVVKDEKTMFGFSADYNALFEVNLQTGDAKYLGSIPGRLFTSFNSSVGMELIDDTIVIAPFRWCTKNTKFKIIEYSLRDNIFYEKELLSNDSFAEYLSSDGADSNLFSSVLKHGKSVFFIPCQYRAIIEYNMENDTCVLHPITLEGGNINENDLSLFGHKEGDCYFVPMRKSNRILRFTMAKREIQWLRIGGKDADYSSCYCDGENLWLTSFADGQVTKFNLTTSRLVKKYKLSKNDAKTSATEDFFGDIINDRENNLLLFPRFSRQVTKFNTVSGENGESEMFSTDKTQVGKQYSKVARFEDKIVVMNLNSWEMNVFDSKENTLDSKQITLRDCGMVSLLGTALENDSSSEIDETDFSNVIDFMFSETLKSENIAGFLERIMNNVPCGKVEIQKRYIQYANANVDGTCGEKTHNFVMDKF